MNRLILILMLFCVTYSYTQNNITITNDNKLESVKYSKEDIIKLNNRVCALLKKASCNPSNDSVQMIHVFTFNILNKINKNDLLNPSFLKTFILLPDYKTYSNYINSTVILLNTKDKLIAVADPNYVYCIENYNESYFDFERFLANKRKEFDISFFFDFIDGLPMQTVYGKSSKGIYVFYRDKKLGLSTSSLIDFVYKFF